MKFGKLPTVDQVDFSLPADPAQNARILRAVPASTAAPRLYVGATGYNMKEWVGKWYPASTNVKAYLEAYGRQFNTIEHNTTHYRIPDAATVARWYEAVPGDFRYCPKIPQTISHDRNLGLNGPEIDLFCTAIAGLQEKLGCCFIQLPPYFSLQNLPVLQRFLERFPVSEIPLAVEVRHESFFQNNTAVEDYYALLQEFRVSTVITDVAGRRDVCHMRLTTGTAMIRFVGNALHASDYQRIEAWANRLAAWFGAGLQEAYFFGHEPDNQLAPELAEYATTVFEKHTPGAQFRGPKPCAPVPQQGTLFE